MKKYLTPLFTIIKTKTQQAPFVAYLALITLLAYGPFFWEKGFYWDEAPWTWIYFRLGPEALTKTFSTSRPFWGMLYQVTLPLLGPDPWKWQLLVILMRFISGYLLYKLVKTVWNKPAHLAELTSILFIVYPGLSQNYISLMYSHFYIVLNLFLLSLLLTSLAIKNRSPYLHIPALFLSLYHLLAMEYFYFLELARFLLIWILLDGRERKVKGTFIFSVPYFLVFIGVTLWRMFFFTNQNASYGYETISNIKANFLNGLLVLASNIFIAFWESAILVWISPFEWVDPVSIGIFTFIGAMIISVFLAVVVFFYSRTQTENQPPKNLLLAALVGLIVWFLGGGAYWLIGSRTMPQLHFSADRFTLSFMLGASLLLASLLIHLIKNNFTRAVIFAILVGFAGGKQFQFNSAYRHDWETQKALFWQMSWRIPDLQPNTTLISNDLPLTYFSDNSLSGIQNWIYSDSGKMQTILYYASVRSEEGRALSEGLIAGNEFSQNYLATTFKGSTSDTIVFNFLPPSCFRVLDPEIDPVNRLIPPNLRDAAKLSRNELIISPSKGIMPPYLMPEISHGWCYYFELAELARQNGQWAEVANLYDKSQLLGFTSNDPLENFVFIEAFAHLTDWEQAQHLTQSTYKVSKEYLRPTLCALWSRIDGDLGNDLDNANAIKEVKQELSCGK